MANNKYWATSSSTVQVEDSSLIGTGLTLEYNPKLTWVDHEGIERHGMYRLNGRRLPKELMGYEIHRTALIDKALSYVSKNKLARS